MQTLGGVSDSEYEVSNPRRDLETHTKDGQEIEPDPRHAEHVLQQIGLTEDKGIGTPGVAGVDQDDLTEDTPLLVLTPSIWVTPLYIVVTSIKYHAIFVILLDVLKGIEKGDQKVIKLTSQVAQNATKN